MSGQCTECERPARQRGLCTRHWQQWRKTAKPSDLNQNKARGGLIGARKRWGYAPRTVRLNGLTDAQRIGIAGFVESLRTKSVPKLDSFTPDQQRVLRALIDAA